MLEEKRRRRANNTKRLTDQLLYAYFCSNIKKIAALRKLKQHTTPHNFYDNSEKKREYFQFL